MMPAHHGLARLPRYSAQLNVSSRRIPTRSSTSHSPSGDIRRSPYDNNAEFVITSVITHEIGHIIGFGEADDRNGEEIYSGQDGRDYTPENIVNQSTNTGVDEWSVMSSGAPSDNYVPPTNANFTAFSIEEWLSLTLSPVNP